MRKEKHKSFRKMLRELRQRCPAIVPVRVRRRPLKDCIGYTTTSYDTDGKLSHFNIVIEKNQCWNATWQVLIHEWAHCIAWIDGHETVTDHGIEFALAFARVYQDVIAP